MKLLQILLLILISNPLIAAEPNCQFASNITIDADKIVWQQLIQQAEQYQRLEDYATSIEILHNALTKISNPTEQAITLGSLGQACFMLGKTESAITLLEASINTFPKATTLNNLGNVYATYSENKKIAKALVYYKQSADLATKTGNRLLAIKAQLNFVQTALKDTSQLPIVKTVLLELLKQIHTIKQDQIKVRLRLGRLMRQTYLIQPAYVEFKLKAFTILTEARQLAHEKQDTWAESQALGYLGQLYFDAGRYQEALQAIHNAILLADDDKFSHNAEILTYYWQWQIGKILKQQGKNSEALAAYRQAVNELWSPSLRYDLAKIYRIYGSSFRQQVDNLFLEFIDLLLKHADSLAEKDEQQIYFKKALDTLENLKAAELFDYFQAECMLDDQLDITILNEGEAVLYPIIFADRIEILLYKSNEIIHVSSYIKKSELDKEITTFLDLISHLDPINKINEQAKILYDLLISPIQNKLNDIETLIFVPDGKLRTIPIAVLYDGNQYLIEKYAIATLPGLTLRLPKNTNNIEPKILLAGYSKAFGNFEALPKAKEELNSIEKLFKQSEKLLDSDFDKEKFKNKLTLNSHIHIASHAKFGGKIENTSILFAEGTVSLNEFNNILLLNRTHDSATQLITLSACETAQGDERAALGLGGIAYYAGINSAVASLWNAKSNFTSQFMPIFYKKLLQYPSKAEALQQAQMEMWKKKPVYKEPIYWAAFILIGNWF